MFRDVLAVHAEDGVEFNPNNLRIELIREQLDYGGLRLSGSATIGGAVVRLLVDIGFGDALEPGVTDIAYPVLLDFPVPRLRAYAPETVVAEKFQFAADQSKQAQWYAIVQDVAIDPGPLDRVIADLATFLMPRATVAAGLAPPPVGGT